MASPPAVPYKIDQIVSQSLRLRPTVNIILVMREKPPKNVQDDKVLKDHATKTQKATIVFLEAEKKTKKTPNLTWQSQSDKNVILVNNASEDLVNRLTALDDVSMIKPQPDVVKAVEGAK